MARRDAGYAMVALLVSLSIIAVLATVAFPAWKHMAQREKEAELIFRGEQYKRAIALFERKNGPGTRPSSINVLVENRFLRRAYRDPMTGGDFQLLRQGGGEATGRAGAAGGIAGVVSASDAQSIRVYGERNHYNEWQFIHLAPAETPQASGGGATPPAPSGARQGGTR